MDRILEAVDTDGDGKELLYDGTIAGRVIGAADDRRVLTRFNCFATGHINIDEFIKGAQQDPWVLNMLKLDMNPYGWVLEQRRKSAHF